MDVSITELRANLKANLERVRRGEEITITDHGTPVAKLVPADHEDRLARLEAAGIISRATSTEPRSIDPAQKVSTTDGGNVADYVIEGRR